jgi:hypothetical protein
VWFLFRIALIKEAHTDGLLLNFIIFYFYNFAGEDNLLPSHTDLRQPQLSDGGMAKILDTKEFQPQYSSLR